MKRYYKVKEGAMLVYGGYNRVHVFLRVNQKWELKALPSAKYPFYTLERSCVLIDVHPDDFERIFKEVPDADSD